MNKPVDFYNDPDFDYFNYWSRRNYEDQAERIALRRLFKQIPKKFKNKLIDIGGGYGRLTSLYLSSFQSSILLDPADKMINEAKVINLDDNLTIKKGQVEKLPFEDDSFDAAILIRVAHHLQNLPSALKEIKRVLKQGGYLILEFPNKIHIKRRFVDLLLRPEQFFDLGPMDRRTEKDLARGAPPFFNYHPRWLDSLLNDQGWQKINKLSVSNFRHQFLKQVLPDKLLLYLEKKLQKLFAYFNLGPSIFLLLKNS